MLRYAGSPAYEEDYLATFVAAPESVLVMAFAADRVIGASGDSEHELRFWVKALQGPARLSVS